ncbi:Aste57867_22306 [Aphanomyces stellatus]|uniref:Aste57867_22306 protein n=1 Tax=Aphanomyces stellatus TaxID=120398 RepID=A0A485LJR6_9STRA|nr:hypothetical protein As57867_022236 [Aphanomyces stellatus]VFT98970.1 Aste57867_22306 [Aphanomyces stellatus]
MRELCERHNVTRQAISRIWKIGQETRASGGCADVRSRKQGNCGRRPKYDLSHVESIIKAVPPYARTTYRSLSSATGIPVASLWKLVTTKKLLRRTSRLKPMLTDSHKVQRLQFVHQFIKSGRQGAHHWDDMLDRIHIDEKWFYVTKVNRKYYLWHDEALPTRKCQSKRFIQKVMFLTAVARPRFDQAKHKMWDGKLGTWAFVEAQLAKRSSKNRPRGSPVTVPITVTKPVYRGYLVDHLFPAIRALWPGRRNTPIYIQQDNARPHVSSNDRVVAAAEKLGGWDINLASQPPMSPDFNVLDLGFFNAIQSLQHQKVTRSVEDLVAAVEDAFAELDWRVLDKTFMTLQKVMEEAFKINGDNAYKLPHLKKDAAAKKIGPRSLAYCDPDVCSAIDALNRRIDYEERVDSLVESFGTSLTMANSDLDEICELVEQVL